MMKRSLSRLLLGVVLLNGSIVYAQQDHHRYEAKLGVVGKDGFYRVALKPEIAGKCLGDRKDVRIYSGRVETPYLFDGDIFIPNESMDFPIVERGVDANKQHFIVFENSLQKLIGDVTLRTESTSAVRSLTLSGSDDRTEWYAIREDFYWSNSDWRTGSITFPNTSYRYLKIVFQGKGALPIKVLMVKAERTRENQKSYWPIPSPSITQRDSNKKSLVTLTFDAKYLISKLEFHVTGPKYFHRKVNVDAGHGYDVMANGDIMEISSGRQSITSLNYTDAFQMDILNDDNPPIHIDSVIAFQDAQSIIAYLEANKSYTLTFGDSTAQAPVYDLSYFKDSIGKQIPELSVGPIQEIKPGAVPPKQAAKDYKWLMWLVIGIVLAGLLYMTMRMLQQMKKGENE